MVVPCVIRYQPQGIELLENCPKCRMIFHQEGFLQLFEHFQGHNDRITKEFPKTFDRETSKVGDIVIFVTGELLALVTRLERKGK